MNLATPIVIPATPFVRNGVTFDTVPQQTLTALNYTLLDRADIKRIQVVGIFPRQVKPLVLWTGDAYRAEYTTAELEARIVEVLGADPASVLAALI